MSSHKHSLAHAANLINVKEPCTLAVFDKLVVDVPCQINPSFWKQLCREHEENTGKKVNQGVKRINIGSKENPLTRIRLGTDFYRIDLNPNRYGSFDNVMQLFEQLFDGFSAQNNLVRRVDINVDLAVPYLSLYESAFVTDKWVSETYSELEVFQKFKCGRKTGCYVGERRNRIAVYDKALELGLSCVWSRIEHRYLCGACPFQNLSRARELFKLRPFDGISFHTLLTYQPSSLSESLVFDGIRRGIETDGLHNTIRRLSKGGHFLRDYARYFQSVEAPPLQTFYENTIQLFFEGGAAMASAQNKRDCAGVL